MNLQDEKGGLPPKNINKIVPDPAPGAVSVVGLVKQSGKITGYQLSDGQNVSKEQGVQMAKDNKIKGVAVAEKKGSEYLRTLPDGTENNNLSNLPSVSE